MQRRRFFAARPVQQVPGQRVEVAVQVRRESAAAVTADPNGGGLYGCAGAGLGTYWVGVSGPTAAQLGRVGVRGNCTRAVAIREL